MPHAEAAAGKAYLAEHARQGNQHPVGLFAVVRALDAPAAHEHGPVLGDCVRQFADGLGRNAADGFCPFRSLGLSVGLAEQVRQEFVEARGVVVEERRVRQVILMNGVSDAEHHCDVSVWTGGDPFSIQFLDGFTAGRVDEDEACAAFF